MPNIMKISPQGQIRIPKKVLEFLQNIMEVRRVIETEATKLAAERASVEDIERIRSIHHEMVNTITNGTRYSDEDFILIDLNFIWPF